MTIDEIDQEADPSNPATAPAKSVIAKSASQPGWRKYAIDVRTLRFAPYRRMFFGTAAASFGAQFTAIAVPNQVYQITNSNAWVGYVSVAGFVPLLVFALWGGALADVLDRRRLLFWSSLLSWMMTLCLFAQAIAGFHNPYLILVLFAVQTGAVAVSMPTRSAIIPRIVPQGEILQANTLNYTTAQISMVAGPLVAGLMVSSSGMLNWAYAVDAVTFTVALWAALRLPPLPPVTGETRRSRGGLSDVVFGLRFIGRTPVLLLSFAIDIVAMVLASPKALFPYAAAHEYGPRSLSWLYSAVAIGSVVAGLSSGWISRIRRQGMALVGAVVLWGVAITLSGLSHMLWLVVLMLALGGAADLVSAVYRQTILQTYTSDELRGRLQGVFSAVVAGGPRLGDLRAGLTATAFTASFAWWGGGVACVIVALALGICFPALTRYRVDTVPTAVSSEPQPDPVAA